MSALPSPIDLRSDTVTRPSAPMREAMASALVGDDVFGEDPTVNELQRVVAELLGKPAALYVPSGSMANQIAIKIHTQPGDEILVGHNAHSWLFETGGAGAISGVQPTLIGEGGHFTADDVEANYKADDHHCPPTSLVSVENTQNMGGGTLWSQAAVADVLRTCERLGVATHLDGARLWNAATASGLSVRELAEGFDTVSVCLSKGLGAPIGSLLCGSEALIHKAHRIRKMLGGGLRQAGIIAAAGLYAVKQNRDRLQEDHDNAYFLAESLAGNDALLIDVSRVHSNIVMIDVEPHWGDAAELETRAKERGLLFCALSPTRIRLVTHLDVVREDCEQTVEILTEILSDR